jgi:hypothetical protein
MRTSNPIILYVSALDKTEGKMCIFMQEEWTLIDAENFIRGTDEERNP